MTSQLEQLNRILFTKVSEQQLERKNIKFRGIVTITNPLHIQFKEKQALTFENTGFQCNADIEHNICVPNDSEILLVSLVLPSFGVWFVKYFIQLNLIIGFSALKSYQLIINTDSSSSSLSQILFNFNNITSLNQTQVTISDSIMHEVINVNETLNIFIKVCYKKPLLSNATLLILKTSIPILTATRIG